MGEFKIQGGRLAKRLSDGGCLMIILGEPGGNYVLYAYALIVRLVEVFVHLNVNGYDGCLECVNR